ncbi:MAG: MscL family protein, partial [Rikenellaceae bacterium]
DLLMPLISIFLGHVNLSDLSLIIPLGGDGAAPIIVNYGNFIQTTIDFLIIALAIFVVVKFAAKFKKQKEEVPTTPSKEEVLLTEIRDILKEKSKE